MLFWDVCKTITRILIIISTISSCSGEGEVKKKRKGKPKPKSELVKNVYYGCGYIKTCLKICLQDSDIRSPCNTCIKTRSCPALVNIRYDRKADEFTSQLLLHGIPESNPHGFIAIGLSGHQDNPPGMINSVIVACIYQQSKLDGTIRGTGFGGYTTGDYTVKYLPVDEPDKHPFYNRKTTYEQLKRDSNFVCEFTWKTKFSIDAGKDDIRNYNLENDTLALIASRGYIGDDAERGWALKGHVPTSTGRVYEKEKRKLRLVPIRENDDYDEDYDSESESSFPIHFKSCLGLYMMFVLNILGRCLTVV